MTPPIPPAKMTPGARPPALIPKINGKESVDALERSAQTISFHCAPCKLSVTMTNVPKNMNVYCPGCRTLQGTSLGYFEVKSTEEPINWRLSHQIDLTKTQLVGKAKGTLVETVNGMQLPPVIYMDEYVGNQTYDAITFLYCLNYTCRCVGPIPMPAHRKHWCATCQRLILED